MTLAMDNLLTHNERILLLQGKIGYSFNDFAGFLNTQNKQVYKVNFNGGDAYFYRHKPTFNFTQPLTEFDEWLRELIDRYDIEAVVCFGDCRPPHIIAYKVCRSLEIDFFVFEEGYLRPNYITFEADGVNGFSRFNDVDIEVESALPDLPEETHNSFFKMMIESFIYYSMGLIAQHRFKHYTYHRGRTAYQEGVSWIKALFLTKYYNKIHDTRLMKELKANHSGQYFLVSLQVYNDSQITAHSDYRDIVEFIDEVIESFAHHAPVNFSLVFKHHPLDRAYRNYCQLIALLANKYDIADRVLYGCDMHLPTLIKHSAGMVTINSTTGLQSIYHKIPVKAMGTAVYNFYPLTDDKPLNKFWRDPHTPDDDFYQRYRSSLIKHTQLNGSMHGQSPWQRRYLE